MFITYVLPFLFGIELPFSWSWGQGSAENLVTLSKTPWKENRSHLKKTARKTNHAPCSAPKLFSKVFKTSFQTLLAILGSYVWRALRQHVNIRKRCELGFYGTVVLMYRGSVSFCGSHEGVINRVLPLLHEKGHVYRWLDLIWTYPCNRRTKLEVPKRVVWRTNKTRNTVFIVTAPDERIHDVWTIPLCFQSQSFETTETSFWLEASCAEAKSINFVGILAECTLRR